MSYQLTAQDFDDVEKELASKPQGQSQSVPQTGGYKLTAQDFDDVDREERQAQQQKPGLLGKLVEGPLAGLQQGLINTAASVPNLFFRASNALDRGLNHILPDNMQLPLTDMQAPVPTLAPDALKNTTGYGMGQSLGEMLPSFAIPGVGALEGAATKLAPTALGTFLTRAAPVADSALTGGAYNALSNANDPTSNLGKDALMGGLLGAGVHGALVPVAALANPVRNYLSLLSKQAQASPGNAVNTLRTPQQAAKAYSDLQSILPGSKVNIFDLVGAPTTGQLTRHLGFLPKSGIDEHENDLVNKAYQYSGDFLSNLSGGATPEDVNQRLVDAVRNLHKPYEDYSKAFVNSLLGDSTPLTVNQDIVKAVKNNFSENREMGSDLFNSVLSRAADDGVKFSDLPNFQATAKEELNKSNKLWPGNEMPSDLQRMLQFGASKSNKQADEALTNGAIDNQSVSSEGVITDPEAPAESEKKPTFDLSTLQANLSNLKDKARNLSSSPNERRIYKSLLSSLEDDIENNLSQHGNYGIYQDWTDAKDFHRENVAPYNDPAILKLMAGKTPAANASNLLIRDENLPIFNHLSPEDKSKLAYQVLAPNLDSGSELPHSLLDAYQKLQPNIDTTTNRLFSDQQHDALNKLAPVQNFDPFRKILAGNADYSQIRNLLLADKNTPVLQMLPDQEKSRLLYSHLIRDNNPYSPISPSGIVRSAKKLTPAQQSRLLNPDQREAIANNNLLSQLIKEPQLSQGPPGTGMRNEKWMKLMALGAAASSVAHAVGLPVAAGASVPLWAAGVGAARKVYSPSALQDYINGQGTNIAARNALSRLLTVGGLNAAN
jgi:hypothetical protein